MANNSNRPPGVPPGPRPSQSAQRFMPHPETGDMVPVPQQPQQGYVQQPMQAPTAMPQPPAPYYPQQPQQSQQAHDGVQIVNGPDGGQYTLSADGRRMIPVVEAAADQRLLRDVLLSKFNRAWFNRTLILAALALGVTAIGLHKSSGSDEYKLPTTERAANDKINKRITDSGGEMLENNNAAHKGQRVQNGKVVLVKFPGGRKAPKYTEDVEGGSDVEIEKQDTQKIPVNERCIPQMEVFRKCVNDTLGADPSIDYAHTSNAMQRALAAKMRKKEPELTMGQHNKGGCSFRISSDNATGDKVPYDVDSKGRAKFSRLRDLPKEALIAFLKGKKGMQIIAKKCGKIAGFRGGLCGRSGDPWLYEDVADISKNDPRILCKKGDKLWKANEKALEDTSLIIVGRRGVERGFDKVKQWIDAAKKGGKILLDLKDIILK